MSNTYINTYIVGYNFLCFIAHIENIVPPVTFIDKFSVALSFQNLKNVDINILECEIYFNIFIKISQFEFLVTTGQRVLVYKLFLSLNIADFNFFKIATPLKKVTPLFPSNPALKTEVLSSSLLLENLVG